MTESVGARVGSNLRRLRLEKRLSLGEVAGVAGISKGTLSRLEAGAGNPTVETLGCLSGALGVPVEALLAKQGPGVRVTRAGEGGWVEGSAVGLRPVDRLVGRGVVDLYEAWFAEGLRRRSGGHAPGTMEHLFVTAGRLRAGPVENAQELGAGDHITFAADVAHLYEAVGGKARGILLISHQRPPSREQELQRELELLLSVGDEFSRRFAGGVSDKGGAEGA